jgi:hypothetical protein
MLVKVVCNHPDCVGRAVLVGEAGTAAAPARVVGISVNDVEDPVPSELDEKIFWGLKVEHLANPDGSITHRLLGLPAA